jgi:LysR family glycine cleavage system transcriptional activator
VLLDRRRLPLNALRAFEATGRHCHMRAAAEELGVTHGAISRHVRHLEALLEVELFKRDRNRLTLTSAGQRLLSAVSEGFERITEGALYIDPERMAGPLRIAATASIATNWLLPVIGEFFRRYPETEIRLQRIEPSETDLSLDFDLAVTYGHPGGRRHRVEELFTEEFFPVASPQLAGPGRRRRRPQDVLKYPLLHDRLQNWPAWLREAGLQEAAASGNLYLHDAFQAINAARRGYGVALADQLEVVEDLRSGRLVRLAEPVLRSAAATYLVQHDGSRDSVRARVFADRLRAAVAEARAA